MFSDITKMIPVLSKTIALLKFRDNKCHCTNIMQHIDTHHSIFRHQNLVELCLDSFLGDDFESLNISFHRLICVLLNLPSISGCETNYSQAPQRVIYEYLVCIRISCLDNMIVNIRSSINQVKNLSSRTVIIEGIDSQVPSDNILFNGVEFNGWISCSIIKILLTPGHHTLNLLSRKLLEHKHSCPVCFVYNNCLCVSLVLTPVSKIHTTIREVNHQVNILDVITHIKIPHTSADNINVLMPRGILYNISYIICYFLKLFFCHLSVNFQYFLLYCFTLSPFSPSTHPDKRKYHQEWAYC